MSSKLLISVSALLYPRRRWYAQLFWWLGMELEGCHNFWCLVFEATYGSVFCSKKATGDRWLFTKSQTRQNACENRFHNFHDFGILRTWTGHLWTTDIFGQSHQILGRVCVETSDVQYTVALCWSPVANESILHWGQLSQPAEWMNCQDMLVVAADLQNFIYPFVCFSIWSSFHSFFPKNACLLAN